MADDYVVAYKAVADFSRLKREARAARRELEKLREAEKSQYGRTGTQDRDQARVTRETTRATTELTDALEGRADATEEATKKTKEDTKTVKENTTTVKESAKANRDHAASTAAARRSGGGGNNNFINWLRGVGDNSDRSSGRVRRLGKNIDGLVGAFGQLGALFKIPFIMVGIGSAIGALLPLVASLSVAAMGLVTSLSSLAGAALALPGIFTALAGAIGGVIIASVGVGAAFKAFGQLTKAQKQAQPVTAKTISQQEKLRRATVDLRYAKQDLRSAEEGLTRAREEARRSLENLRKEVQRASLNEEGARANLLQAQERYREALADPTQTAADRAQALYELHRAEADLVDTQEKNIQNREDLADLEKKGIKNSDQVVAALRNVEQSQRAVLDAQVALQNARTGADSPLSAEAQAANAYQQALKELSPSARKFVEWLVAFRDTWKKAQKDIQESFFSRFVGDLDLLKKLLPTITKFFKGGAEAAGDFVDKLLKMISSGPWARDFETVTSITKTVIKNLGDAFLSVADGLRNVIVVAGPFTKWLVRAVKHGAEMFNTLTKGGRATGKLADWLDHVKWRLQKTGKILKNFGKGIFGYFSAAGDLGDWILKRSVKVFKKFADAGEAAKKEGSPFRKMLEDMKPALTEVSKLFSDTFKEIRERFIKNIPTMQPLLQQIREDLMPAIFDLFDSLSKPETIGKVIDGLTRVLDALTDLFNGGLGDGLSSFFEGIALVLEALGKVQDLPGGTAFMKALVLLAGIGGGMALVLGPVIKLFKIFGTIGKFSGLTKLITKLTALGGGAAAATAVAGGAGTAAAASGAAAAAGGGAAAAGGAGAAKTLLPKWIAKLPKSGKVGLVAALFAAGYFGVQSLTGGSEAPPAEPTKPPKNPTQQTGYDGKPLNNPKSLWDILGIGGDSSNLQQNGFFDPAASFNRQFNTGTQGLLTPDVGAAFSAGWNNLLKVFGKGDPSRDFLGNRAPRPDVSGARYAAQAARRPAPVSKPVLFGDKQTPPSARQTPGKAPDGRDWSEVKKEAKTNLTALRTMVTTITGEISETWTQFWLTLRTSSTKAFEFMKKGADAFRLGFLQAFRGIQSGLTGILTAVVTALIAPTNFIVNSVLGGLVRAINSVMAALGLSAKIPVPALNLKAPATGKGAKPAGFASGGSVPGVGSTDTVPAMLTPGEYVLRKSTVAELQRKYPGMLGALNTGGTKALRGVQFYNDGGLVAGADAGTLVSQKGADAALSALMAPILTSAESMIGPFGEIATGLARKIAAKAPQYVSSAQSAMFAPGGAFIGAMVPTPLLPGMTPGQRVGVGNGNYVDAFTYARLRAAERLLGFRLSIGQGSFENASSYSGTTHTGAGAIDVSIRWLEMARRLAVVNALRRAGFAAWRRTPDQGDWVEHVHALAIGAPGMSSSAVNQVRSYLSGGDGLGHVDSNPWRPGQRTEGKTPKRVPHGASMGFNLGGLVPPMAPSVESVGAMSSALASGATSNRYGHHFGDVIIQNPRQERASESLYRTVQKMTLGI